MFVDAPLADYIEMVPGAYDDGAKEMAAAVGEAAEAFTPGSVLITLHHTFLSYLALELVDAMAPAAPETEREEWVRNARGVILPVNTGEVCAFKLTAEGATYLANPLDTDFVSVKSNDGFVTGGTAGT